MKREKGFHDYCRENTGKAMCDSGDYYGRHYEKSPIPADAPEVAQWLKGCSATLETAVFLAERMELLPELQAEWEKWDGENGQELDWFVSGREFLRGKLRHSVARGNICNNESDLSQAYVWDVFIPDGEEPSDWIYAHDAVVIIHIHCGCDVRSGYSRPIFCKSKGDYCIPTDLCAEYHAEPVAYPKDGPDIDWEHFQAIDEKWQTGYTSWPYGALEGDVEEWHEHTRDRDSVEVTLKTGERVRVRATAPYFGG